MKAILLFFCLILIISCQSKNIESTEIIFLHHSTGFAIWRGNTNRYVYRLTKKGDVDKFISKYNKNSNSNYQVTNRSFPTDDQYGWRNNPFDYYNIWVKNAGADPYLGEPTLEMLTKSFDVIIFKHCYTASNILEDTGNPDIDSNEKRIENYKLQYDALKKKMLEFPDNKFILWTPAVKVQNGTTEEKAIRTKKFYEWVINEWDAEGDNIYIWDFYKYETEGGLFLKDEYAVNPKNSHPNKIFSGRVAPLFSQFCINCIEGTEP